MGAARRREGPSPARTSRCKVGQAEGADPPECHCCPSHHWPVVNRTPHVLQCSALCPLPLQSSFSAYSPSPVSIRSAWLLERGLRRFSAAATETELPRCRTQRKKATSRQRAKPASSAGVSPSSAWVFNRWLFLRFRGLQTGIRRNCFRSKHL